jgi:predicted secreted Zn-dependent protease
MWHDLHARLQTHEQRHREHAEAAARQLHGMLSARRDRRETVDCLRLQTDLEALRHRTLQDLRMRDRVFDSSTSGALDVRRSLPRSGFREQPAAR